MKIAKANINVLSINLKFEKNLFTFTAQMINLLIDIGNSSTKVALTKENQIIEDFKFVELHLDEVIKILDKNKINNSALSNVARPTPEIEKLLMDRTSFYSITKSSIPIKVPYTIETVGQDRLALMIAAYADYPNDNVLVIDMGTCITYDIKKINNEYLAGGISPGLQMRVESISKGAFNLSDISPTYPNSLIASDTKSSLDIGIVKGIQYEIEGFIQKYSSDYSDLKVIITGGGSKILSGKIKNTIFTNSNYIFKGLDFLIEYNRQNA